MTTRNPKKSSSIAKGKPIRKVIHICNQEDEISRHGVLLERVALVTLGNGTPENGLLFMFRAFLEREKDRKEDIREIKDKLEKALSATSTTANALEIYKAEMEGIGAGKKVIEEQQKETDEKNHIAENLSTTKSRDLWYKVFTVLALSASIYFGFRNGKKSDQIETKVQNQGTPYVSNKRGELILLPDSSQIHFWPYDSLTYTITRVK